MARIALDIDSTLHHYWDLLEDIAMQRFGVAIPYAEQLTWEIPRLSRADLAACIAESHSERNIAASEPYPGAVEAVNRWHDQGHFIHVTSHRRPETAGATHAWLADRGFRYDDLHCSFDKVSRCAELGIDLLVDDSPVNLAAVRELGMVAATITHPWNREMVRAGEAVGEPGWPELERALAPVIAAIDAGERPQSKPWETRTA